MNEKWLKIINAVTSALIAFLTAFGVSSCVTSYL